MVNINDNFTLALRTEATYVIFCVSLILLYMSLQ